MGGAHRGEGRGRLYVVATPIGNLADITLRALEVLRSVALVLAEDTRSAANLLSHHGIAARTKSLHQHNEAASVAEVLERLAGGQEIALVSEAGTPAISDPGAVIVAAVREAGFDVVPIPGPNAAVAALSASGFAGPFAFVGFLPAKSGARKHALEAWRACPHTLVFYEAPHRIAESIADLAEVLGGGRRVVIARELTKLFESIHACALAEAGDWLAATGIGRPEGFFDMLHAQGVRFSPRAFADHHVFRPQDLPADGAVLMTEKDAVKCLAFAGTDWWAVELDVAPETGFIDWLGARFKR